MRNDEGYRMTDEKMGRLMDVGRFLAGVGLIEPDPNNPPPPILIEAAREKGPYVPVVALKAGHDCEGTLPHGGYGEALDSCWEFADDTLWVGNSEYASHVNFCPYCGFKALKQVGE